MPVALKGSVLKRQQDSSGGWSENGQEGDAHDTKRSVWNRPEFIVRDGGFPWRGNGSHSEDTKSRQAEVRASIVAMKPGNSGGAKGTQGDWMTNDQGYERHTDDSAAGSTSRRSSPRMAVRPIVCLDSSHVDGSHYGSGKRTMVPTV
jgi:hypothetical protein